ncbi:glycosyltransferase [Methylobacterium sp. A54F]
MADWPFGTPDAPLPRPATLPDGRPWPRIRVLTAVPADAPDLASASVASVARQDYPELRHDLVPAAAAEAALAGILAEETVAAVLLLRAGDLLAPGALQALALERALAGADAVAGLRVLFDRQVLGLDVLALDVPALDGAKPASLDGGILFGREALAGTARGLDAAAAWAALARAGAPLARIGRPVLLHRAPGRETGHALTPGLSVAALTGTGYAGGAGIAHRRLAEALRLSGHRVAAYALTDESPAAAAEWTDHFPRTEAAIRGGGHDLVLAGNLHGATRSLDILGRLGTALPVASVLHDLFALTGRCAHPRGCLRIATGCDAECPSPDEYPQLAPRRIAPALARKRAVLGAPGGPLLLANSAWTAEQARALAPDGARVAPLTLAFPTGVFRPRDRQALRRELGLPADDLLILVSSVIVDGPDKGFSDLRAALLRVAGPGIGFVAVGRLDDPGRLGLPNLFVPGLIHDEARLAAWYGACDLHVTASRLETLGQTPIEAGLCGVPTLAYRTAGLTTSVIDGVSGRLVPVEPGALAQALEALVADRAALARLGAFARIALESRFSHAAAALSLQAALEGLGLAPRGAPSRFAPEMLATFAMARARRPGEVGAAASPAPPLVRTLRRAKQAVLGRTLPLWLRRGLYGAARLRAHLRLGR